MTITPGELLDISIAQLQTLAAFLADQLSDQSPGAGAPSSSAEARVCRELGVSLGALIHTLRAARPTTSLATRPDPREAGGEPPGPNRDAPVRRAPGPAAESTL